MRIYAVTTTVVAALADRSRPRQNDIESTANMETKIKETAGDKGNTEASPPERRCVFLLPQRGAGRKDEALHRVGVSSPRRAARSAGVFRGVTLNCHGWQSAGGSRVRRLPFASRFPSPHIPLLLERSFSHLDTDLQFADYAIGPACLPQCPVAFTKS